MGSRKLSVMMVSLGVLCVQAVLVGCRKDAPSESGQHSTAPAAYAETAPESTQEKDPPSPDSSISAAPASNVQPPSTDGPKQPEASHGAQAPDRKPSKDASEKKSPEKNASSKKKGTAGKIAEKQTGSAGAAGAGPLVPRDPKIAFIEFTEPIAWPVSTAASGGEKLLYAFKLTDAKDKKKKATLTVSFMPDRKGKTTTVLKNWCEDFLLKGGGHPSVGELAKDEEINGLKVTTLELQGAVKQAKSGDLATGQRLIAAVVQHPKGPFFIRASGPAELIDPRRDAILKFIRSVRKATPAPPSSEEPALKAPADKEEGASDPGVKVPEPDEQADAPAPQPAQPESSDPPKP
ncbi:MAG: hypothetical protein IT449_10945 [Phycisphaerales bacterium]|nr:hypothetical protein [Phycisphaerales bacterium]